MEADDELIDKLRRVLVSPPVDMEPEDIARWHRAFASAAKDYERRARRIVPRLGRLAPPGDMELPIDLAEVQRQAARSADAYVRNYRALIDGGYWCDKDRTDDLKGFL